MEKTNKLHAFFNNYKRIFATEFKGYKASHLLKDILAGMTVGAVALPLALAFGAASVDPAHAAVGIAAGLITAILAGIVTGLLGGGSFQISGPTGAMTVVLTGIVAGKYGLTGMFLACLLAGAIMMVAGLLKFGKLVQFIPRPVVTGFTSGVAIIIALGQLGNFFGVSLSGETTLDKVIYFFSNTLTSINAQAVLCAVAVVLIMAFYPKKWAKFVPASLVAIIFVTVFAAICRLDVQKIGSIPMSLVNSERLQFSAINAEMLKGVIGASLTIAALGMIESLLCGTCAANMKKESFDSNVELIAQGIGNMIIPFFGGVPSTAALARTSVAINSGGKTRLTSVFQSVFLIACMFLFAKAIGFVPYAALAGVLVVTAFKMNEWHAIRYYFKTKLWDAIAMFLITMIATVLLDLTYAILIGVGISMILLIVKLSKLDVQNSEIEMDTDNNNIPEDSVIIYATGALFFANSNEFARQIETLEKNYEHYIFSLRGIISMDVTAIDALTEMVNDLRGENKKLSFTGVAEKIEKTMKKTGFYSLVGEENFYQSIDKIFAEFPIEAEIETKIEKAVEAEVAGTVE